MAGTKTVIHLVITPEEIPNDFEDKVCALVDVYENGERTTESYRTAYEDLTPTEQQLWNDFVTMIASKAV